eukprot:1166596-Prymnesium_polylepis.1
MKEVLDVLWPPVTTSGRFHSTKLKLPAHVQFRSTPLRSADVKKSCPDRLRLPPELRSEPAAQGACFLATVTDRYRVH